MKTKIDSALTLIDKVLREYKNPALMCSFGKDSMVLLDLLLRHSIKLPVIFHRDPWWPKKYAFADGIILEWNLEVHDYPPAKVTLWEGEAIMAFTNHYQIGPQALLQLPKNILQPQFGEPFLCGLKQVLGRPTGTYQYPFDVVLVGHKSSDEDQIAGKVPLHVDVKLNGGAAPDAAFPLRGWTDKDIWDYTEAFEVPQQPDRYKDRKELPDKTANSDYAHVCIACLDKRNTTPSVYCPKIEAEVSNISQFAPYEEPAFTYYGANS